MKSLIVLAIVGISIYSFTATINCGSKYGSNSIIGYMYCR
jgi:hypothetical protein